MKLLPLLILLLLLVACVETRQVSELRLDAYSDITYITKENAPKGNIYACNATLCCAQRGLTSSAYCFKQ